MWPISTEPEILRFEPSCMHGAGLAFALSVLSMPNQLVLIQGSCPERMLFGTFEDDPVIEFDFKHDLHPILSKGSGSRRLAHTLKVGHPDDLNGPSNQVFRPGNTSIH